MQVRIFVEKIRSEYVTMPKASLFALFGEAVILLKKSQLTRKPGIGSGSSEYLGTLILVSSQVGVNMNNNDKVASRIEIYISQIDAPLMYISLDLPTR
jgi:hypothetical protein